MHIKAEKSQASPVLHPSPATNELEADFSHYIHIEAEESQASPVLHPSPATNGLEADFSDYLHIEAEESQASPVLHQSPATNGLESHPTGVTRGLKTERERRLNGPPAAPAPPPLSYQGSLSTGTLLKLHLLQHLFERHLLVLRARAHTHTFHTYL